MAVVCPGNGRSDDSTCNGKWYGLEMGKWPLFQGTPSPHLLPIAVGIRAEPHYQTHKTKHGTLCLTVDGEIDVADDDDGQRETSKPLDYWLNLGFKEIILHVNKRTHAIINDRNRSAASEAS